MKERLLFYIPGMPRKELMVDLTQANSVRHNIQALIDAKKSGIQNSAAEVWFSQLPNSSIKKCIVKWGLLKNTEKKTIDDLLESLIKYRTPAVETEKGYKYEVRILKDFFGDTVYIQDINRTNIVAFIEYLNTRLSPLSRKVIVTHLRSMFNYAVLLEWINTNPFSFIRIGGSRNPDKVRYVSTEETKAAITSTTNHKFKTIVALLRFAGARGGSEIKTLTWDRVIWTTKKPGYIIIQTEKTKRFEDHILRRVPLHPVLEECLKNMSKKTEKVIQGKTDGLDTNPIAKNTFKRINIDIQVGYNLRRSFCSDMMELIGGTDPKAYASICGHSFSLGMQYYQIMHPDRESRAMNTITEAWKETPDS